MTGLLGLNGAGKTTLLRMLLGLIRPDEGRIVLLGTDLAPGRRAFSRVLRVSSRSRSFYPYLPGRANLEVLAELDDDDDVAHTRISRVLEQVELDGRAGDRVSGYSSGMRQRLGIAAALMRVPRLLLLDEPTSGLDPAGVRFVGELIGSLAAEGVDRTAEQSSDRRDRDGLRQLRDPERGAGGVGRDRGRAARPSPLRRHTGSSLSDDARAVVLAGDQAGIRTEGYAGEGFVVRADQAALDRLVLSLGRAGVAVRGLELLLSPLASMFFSLTGEQSAGLPAVPIDGPPAGRRPGRVNVVSLSGAPSERGRQAMSSPVGVWRAETRKLRAQLASRLLVLVCVFGPCGFWTDPQPAGLRPRRHVVWGMGARIGLRSVARGARIRRLCGVPGARRSGGPETSSPRRIATGPGRRC